MIIFLIGFQAETAKLFTQSLQKQYVKSPSLLGEGLGWGTSNRGKMRLGYITPYDYKSI